MVERYTIEVAPIDLYIRPLHTIVPRHRWKRKVLRKEQDDVKAEHVSVPASGCGEVN